MDNSNFSFLKEYDKEFYEQCCKVDFFIYGLNLYPEALATARKIIEYIVEPNKDEEETLFQALKRKEKQYSKVTRDCLHTIREEANKVVHSLEKSDNLDKDSAVKIAKDLHHVTITEVYLKKFKGTQRIEDYRELDSKDPWIKEKHFQNGYISDLFEYYREILFDLKMEELAQEIKEDLSDEIDEKIKSEVNNHINKHLTEALDINKDFTSKKITLDDDQLDASHFWDKKIII